MTLTHFFSPRAAAGRRRATPAPTAARSLGLRAGEWVEVLPLDAVMATLDAGGALDGMPFMPEMVRFCGRRFQVFKTAHKTCDTIATFTGRRLAAAVHLVGLRCDGGGHGGCQASCLIFWKEAWLRRVDGPVDLETPPAPRGAARSDPAASGLAQLERQAQRDDPEAGGEPRYRCQATELLSATTPLSVWHLRAHLQDIRGGNHGVVTWLVALLRGVAQFFHNKQQQLRWRLFGTPRQVPPASCLDLKPGELVQVRSRAEIMATLEDGVRNRGLSFDPEMALFCGRTMRVLRRVERIIDEKTGRMLKLRKDCIMLEGGVCTGLHAGLRRLGCPRAVYTYWREAWLRRDPRSGSSPAGASDCGGNRESPPGAD